MTARNENQENRIENGVKSGQLTPSETKALNHQQEHIENTAERYKESGGGINPSEKMRLDNMQDRASANIYRQKHDDQNMPGANNNQQNIAHADSTASPVAPVSHEQEQSSGENCQGVSSANNAGQGE